MKKILFVLVALLFAAPVFADVDITVVQDGDNDCVAIISFDATSEPNLVRAFSLDIQADNDANIVDVTLLSDDYIIHPGTIVIDTEGTVQDYGSPVAPQSDLPSDTKPGLDSNGVTIEMGSLYAPVGIPTPNTPAPSGPLVSVTVDKECTLTITANVSRAGPSGLVMESPDEVVTVNLPAPLFMAGCNVVDTCIKLTAPEFNAWVSWNQPDCWCYKKQCRGDINGALFLGKPVTLADLNTFKLAFNQIDSVVAGITGGICCDLNHAPFLGKRVTLADLNIFKTYFNVVDASVPCCDANQDCIIDAGDTVYNFWTN